MNTRDLGEQFPAPAETTGTMRGRCHPSFYLALIGLLWLGSAFACSSQAHAQAWLSDRARTEGHGIRVGDLELHPGIGSELGYTNNVFYSEKQEGSAILRVSPHLLLSTLGEERRAGNEEGPSALPGPVGFRGGLSGSLMKYFATPLSDTVSLGGNVDFQLVLNPQRPVSFAITEALHHTESAFPNSAPENTGIMPTGATGTIRAASVPNSTFGRNQQTVGAQLMLASPGGLLRTELGYRFGIDDFVNDAYRANRNSTHTVDSRTSWEFLPKTAIFHEAAFTYQNYIHDTATSAVSDNKQVTTRIGLNGAVTSTVAGTAAVGYVAGFFDKGNSLENISLLLDTRWVPSETAELGLSYARDFGSAFQGNFVQHDRVYVHSRLVAGGAWVFSGKAGVEVLAFGRDIVQGPRSDLRPFVDVSGEYRFASWLAMTGQFGYLQDITDFAYKTPTPAGTAAVAPIPAKFTRLEGWLGLRAFY